MAHCREYHRRLRFVPAAVIALAAASCAAPGPRPASPGTDPREESRPGLAEESKAPQEKSEMPVGVHRFALVAADAPPGREVIEAALKRALGERGFVILDDAQTGQADWVLIVCGATRTGEAWGGIPRQEVSLRYSISDPSTQASVCSGCDSGAYADPDRQKAILGAAKEAAGNLARKLVQTAPRLVHAPRPPAPPPPEAEKESPWLAALPFQNRTGRAQLDGWCDTLASVAAEELRRTRHYRIRERVRMKELLSDQDLVDVLGRDKGAIRSAGERLAVAFLLVGEVVSRPNGEIAVSARLVRTEDNEGLEFFATEDGTKVNDLEEALRRALAKPVKGWLVEQLRQMHQAPVVWPDSSRR